MFMGFLQGPQKVNQKCWKNIMEQIKISTVCGCGGYKGGGVARSLYSYNTSSNNLYPYWQRN